jgi:hypothetical protein
MRWIIVIAVATALTGCSKPAEESRTAGAAGVFEVERLFTHDGCSVYRFWDAGTQRYFTNCSGDTAWRESCGKNCTRDVTVPGGAR